METWLVELKGTEKSLEFLRNHLKTHNPSIVKDERATYLQTSDLGDETDPSSQMAAIKHMIDVVNGAATLLWPHFDHVSSNTIHKDASDGSRRSFSFVTAHPPDRLLYGFLPDDPTLTNWISLSHSDPYVEKALILYAVLEHDWRGLYMILETITDEIGGEKKLVAKGWLSNSQLRSFKHTANSFAAVGHLARHATMSIIPPTKPMPLENAKTLVDDVLVMWLRSKCNPISVDPPSTSFT